MDGSLYRGAKPVMWSLEKTALAEAEIEYEDHTSVTIYARFPVKSRRILPLKGRQSLFGPQHHGPCPGTVRSLTVMISAIRLSRWLTQMRKPVRKGDVLVIADDLADYVIEAIGG